MSLRKYYRYLGKIHTPFQALLVSGALAALSCLLSLLGTELVFKLMGEPGATGVKILVSLLPFTVVMISSFLLIRGFILLDQRNRYLVEVADRDDLTRLANRASFMRKGREMLSQAGLKDTALSMIMLDADHFKSINDNYGHLAGDLALQHLADIFRQSCRDDDLIGRWGGEEFAIVLRGAKISGAQIFAERIRNNVANAPFYWEGQKITLTLSAGVAEWNANHDDLQSLILRADKALYYAKAAGRNQVRIATHIPPSSHGVKKDAALSDAAA